MKFEFEYFSYTVYLGCITICCVNNICDINAGKRMFVLCVLNYFHKCGILPSARKASNILKKYCKSILQDVTKTDFKKILKA